MSEKPPPHGGSCHNDPQHNQCRKVATSSVNGHQKHCACLQTSTVAQGLDEMEFERGIWTAALDNNIDRLRDHIARGETNRRDNFGYTALHYAARQRHADACRLLLAAGADANTQTTAGAVTALHRAASAGGAEIVRMLLAHGARVQMTDDDGNTALHRAAAAGHVDICVMLCSRDQGAVSTMKVLKNKRGQRAADLVRADRRSDLQSVFDFAIAEAEVAE